MGGVGLERARAWLSALLRDIADGVEDGSVTVESVSSVFGYQDVVASGQVVHRIRNGHDTLSLEYDDSRVKGLF